MVPWRGVQHLGSWGTRKPGVYLREIPLSKHGSQVSRLLFNVLFVKFPVGQVLSPLLQSRGERKKQDSDRGLSGPHA